MAIIEQSSAKSSNKDMGLWSSLRGVPMRLIERPKNFFLRTAIRSIVDLSYTNEINDEIKAEMALGKVPILITNHQQHIDGFVFAVTGKHMKRLVAAIPGAPPFPGFIAPGARSWEEGYQGGHLKVGLEVFREAGEQLGVKVAGVTRGKDGDDYGMDRSQLPTEMLPIARELRRKRGLALLPEGSWKGGRHPYGAGTEEIYGVQPFAVNMAEWVGIVERATGREAFIIVAGINGSYRYVRNGEKEDGKNEEPKITPEGWRALIIGIFGLHIGYRRIQAKLQSVITRGKIEAALGRNWRENGEVFNEYLTEQIELAIPEYARRADRRSVKTPAIELSTAS
ncbi:hypothetical protein A2867_01545 [Candidatus Daviesbacteria bacterium RIFCSPHIGHO2_01_FULL_40_11]|uniref:Phospholipid/glycerol acyltransferase domain-containing protein n=1 Tax=Candidatus Daviesbacteria bacterium RIFCSPHIGHO2_01_FULL_40_11 TaxID=1797762 RepID=A0A1F5JHD1_9BACT|nr:MAG: hypothetical protein A2867_01545 [Candidatus Daviesbacteria bacterium RIFCSPHIGHO2_01_FULL_40_11]OGE62624.1 MAG: hypothetical protein A2964_02540 [Candidatus Daviesbacteria bacterium RIFCSPLOWO2_01_FULL_40_27]